TGAGDWRAHLQPEARSRIVERMMETLKTHLPVSEPEGLNELQKIAVRFEQNIYTEATNQSDYFWKISLKMLPMESKTQQAPGNAHVIPNQNNSDKHPRTLLLKQAMQVQMIIGKRRYI
uniref:Mediator complex subunit 15 KIX domain-containing protein n=2 Tax=Aegilops tauschii subsp. strangulata TaxID=200361 RepID=A0A452ZLQ0_AEGTS